MLLRQEEVNEIKEKYPVGTRIRLIHMDDMQSVPPDTLGTIESVDDQGQLHMKWDNGRGLALIPGVDQFEVEHEMNQQENMRVIIVEPNKHPRVEIIKKTLETEQKIVGGYMEELDFDDGAVIICNEEGKILDLKANRKVGSDIIAGTFFIAGDDGSESLVSLTDEQIDKYMQQFYEIEEHTQEELQGGVFFNFMGW